MKLLLDLSQLAVNLTGVILLALTIWSLRSPFLTRLSSCEAYIQDAFVW